MHCNASYALSALANKLNGSKDCCLVQGINWFGFETLAIVAGLWTQPQISNDFQYVAWRMKLLGFNTVRLPFSFQVAIFQGVCATSVLVRSSSSGLLHAVRLTTLMSRQ